MKAFVYTEYGPPEVLKLVELEVPAPKENEVLVKVSAASVNARDWHLLKADPIIVRLMGGGLLRPKSSSLGSDVAGRIEAVGSAVTRFKPGDEVFGDLSGGGFGGGGFAEYVCANENALIAKPAGMTFEQAAAIPMAGVTALQGLRDVGLIQGGQQVLINGASGGVGTFAVQIAKYFGTEVTAVCSTGKVELARSIGADKVIDYTVDDFTKSGQRYDLILAANGYHPISDYKRALKPGGRYVATGGTMPQIFQALLLGPLISITGGKNLAGVTAVPSLKDLTLLKDLFIAGKVIPVIDRRFPFAEVPDALRYLDDGHPGGKVVVTIGGS
jgi:NADPH:quinone reductase-like Zn-dependent oxidoreductase